MNQGEVYIPTKDRSRRRIEEIFLLEAEGQDIDRYLFIYYFFILSSSFTIIPIIIIFSFFLLPISIGI